MKPMVSFFLIAFFLTSCVCLINLEDHVTNQPNTNTVLGETFFDESCVNPCWRGIEVGVSNRELVETALDESGLDYVLNGPYTYNIFFENNSSPIWEGVSNPAADIHLVDGDIVGIMSFAVDLCPSSILDTYGYPEVIEGRSYFRLLYPNMGLNFFLSLETQRVYAVLLYPLDYIDQHFPLSEMQEGVNFHDLFTASCSDGLSTQ